MVHQGMNTNIANSIAATINVKRRVHSEIVLSLRSRHMNVERSPVTARMTPVTMTKTPKAV